jgi:hypothetical protein
MKRLFPFFLIILAIIKILVLSGCANIVPPSGGVRDTIPPVLLKVTPADSTRNFTGKTIVFTFDEFVDVQDIQQNLLISPLPKTNPVVDFKLRTVTVRLRDTLEANTTYSIDFGNTIRDFTEGNPIKDFTYTFSTGRYIDSLELHGNVILAETGKVDTTLIVMLHTNPTDSAVIKDKPRYIAKVDSKGNFEFRNLPPKRFYLYALKDESGTRRYFNDKQLFAFADKPIDLDSITNAGTLYAYAGSKSTGGAVPGLNIGIRRKQSELSDKRLRYQTSISGNQQDLLTDLTITFEQALRSFDSSRIKLYTDSTYNSVSGYRFYKDSSNKKIILATTLKENTLYHIILDKDFAEDSSGRKLLKTDTISFTSKKLSDYGSLRIRLRNISMDKNPVLQFVQNEEVYRSFPLTGPDFSQSIFLPGEYELRILYDTNKNGKWDAGEFFKKHRQPEIVKPIGRRITVKAAWQNEFELAL